MSRQAYDKINKELIPIAGLDVIDSTPIQNSSHAVSSGGVYSELHKLSDENADIVNVLGAKNVLPNNTVTQVISGITFSINTNKSVTVSGSSTTGWGNLYLFTPAGGYANGVKNLIPPGDYILSGAENCSPEDMSIDLLVYKDANDYIRITQHAGQDPVRFIIPQGYDTFVGIIMVPPQTQNVSGTFYPMIRPASIKDDTYVPYAMTNRELSDYYYKKRMITEIVYAGNTEITPSTPTYIAQHNGLLSIACRIGSSTTVVLTINNKFVASYYTADITAATERAGCPIILLASGVHVKAGDVISLLRNYGSYAWVENAIINYNY